MQVRIVTNPHLEENDAKPFLDELLRLKDMYTPAADRSAVINGREFDRAKFEQLRNALKTPRRRSPGK